jgi:rare lipoprotein A
MSRSRWAIGLLLLALPASSSSPPPPPQVAAAPPAPCTQTGTASWYRPKTATTALVAAHQTLPLGTQVTVTELASGRSVVVRVVDRGPFAKGRIIDISSAAAAQLGMKQGGVAQVRLEIAQPSSNAPGVQPAAMTEATCPFPKNTAA